MGRRSSIDQGSPGVRKHILMRLRENRLTLAELRADLEALFPAEKIPSKSALGRHRASIEEMISHEREMAVAAEAMVAELGEGFDAKSGALLAQAVTTLASRTAMNRLSSGADMDIADVLDLARAAKAAQEARSLNLKERNEVARLAREKLLAEQSAKLEASRKDLGVSDETMHAIRQRLGIT